MSSRKGISPRRVLHVITSLETGGAQVMLLKLLHSLDSSRWHSEVIFLKPGIGPIGQRLRRLGIPVETLHLHSALDVPRGVVQLSRRLRRDPPDVVQTWMYHGDLIGGLAARLAGSLPTIWGIRHGSFDSRATRRSTRLAARACALLSWRLPRRIVCVSEASRQLHTAMGYDGARMIVIPNGFDLGSFRPDEAARRLLRAEIGVEESAFVIGLAARFDLQKDHATFVEAARRLHERRPDVHFVLCGEGVDLRNRDLTERLEPDRLRHSFHLLGLREDMARVTAALDIASSSSSFGEGFSNAVGEAMACGVPCVVTDVGDSAAIVGETGRVVPPRDPDSLAAAWLELMDASREARAELGAAARRRIMENFDLPDIVGRYERLYAEVVG